MKTLLLTVALSLTAVLQAQDPPAFLSNRQNITGTWYMKAIVTDKKLPEKTWPHEAYPLTVRDTGTEDLEVTITFMKEGQCYEKTVLMQPTEQPGQYIADEGRKRVSLWRLPEGHAIFYCEGSSSGRQFRAMKLMGREPGMAPKPMEESKKFIKTKGFEEREITVPTQKERCETPSD
ncbi:major allergen Can f 1-like [Tupaia chinensis]|uniref:major allergen Can f 1-like n=1 Tax=Tupaia chinensis TaxID=246437 RepID=UPI0003C8EA00|nr:major allergen Can f 1-like [Tupaia chinensis]